MAHCEELIVVIGAGISGLSCAHYLIKNGIKNVKVLDAKDRIGGRVHTVRPEGILCWIIFSIFFTFFFKLLKIKIFKILNII